MQELSKGVFKQLESDFNALSERLQLPEDVADEIYGFIQDVAKENYMAGNRSGIRWARMNGTPPITYIQK